MSLNNDYALLVHLKLDETSGTTADNVGSSGATNDGTLTGVDFATDSVVGKHGNALSFVNAIDEVNLNSLGLGNVDVSYSLFFRANVAISGTGFFISTWDSTAGLGALTFQFGDNAGTARFLVYIGSTYKGEVNVPTLDDGNWHHCAITYTASTRTLSYYFDGTAIKTVVLTVGTWDSTQDAKLHNRGGWSSTQDVTFDDVRVYTRVLTSSEIIQLAYDSYYDYNLNNCPELEVLYKMNNDATDSSPNGRNGTAVLTSYVSGKYGRALANVATAGHYFQGTNNTVLDFTTENMSVAFWVYVNTSADLYQYPFARASYNVSGYAIIIKRDIGRISFMTMTAGSNVTSRVDLGTTIIDTWNHFCFTRQGSSILFYLNGILQAWDVAATHPDFITHTGSLYIGALHSTSTQNLNGIIDDVRVYSRILSSDEAYLLATNPYGLTNKKKKFQLLGA